VRAYKNSPTYKSLKMLASTVQFSTYDQTPITRPHQPRHTLGCRQRYEMQTGPDTRSLHTPYRGWSALSGPNSVPTTDQPLTPRSMRHE
jgi:hypothetical protein